MFIATAQNVTQRRTGRRELADNNGIATYDVWIGINHHCIWKGIVDGFLRKAGAAALLRKIADEMDSHPFDEKK